MAGATGEVERNFGSAGPGDPFGSSLESPFGPTAPNQPAPLDDPFGSSLGPASPFDSQPRAASTPSGGSPLDSMMDLGAPGGSSSFTSDPVNVEASVDIKAGSISADPVLVTVPVEITLSSGGREILVPIRLQLKVRIR